MNSNYMSEHQAELRKAVEEQLDLILKMQEQRKALKKQNKHLAQQLKTANQIMNKYRVETTDSAVNTEQQVNKKQDIVQEQHQRERKLFVDQHTQVDQENNSYALNCSKLTEAQSLLKALDTTQQVNQQKISTKIEEQPSKTVKKTDNSSKQITNQIVKMTKQINSLKRELKQSMQKQNQKQKEVRQLKKCLQTKTEALQKSRKDFNELSIIMNTDKFKSIKQLEQQIKVLRVQVRKNEDSAKLKKILEGVTAEYDEYRKQMEKKWEILIEQLACKEKQNEMLNAEHKKVCKQLESLCVGHDNG